MIGIEPDTSEINRFIRQLEGVADKFAPQRARLMTENVINEVLGIMEDYPNETAANQPPPPYYSRGRGTIGAGGNILYQSGNMREAWKHTVSVGSNEVVGEIRNDATGAHVGGGQRIYPSYTHGTATEQAWFHRQRGWKSLLSVTQAAVGDDNIEISYPGVRQASDNPTRAAEDIIAEIERF